MIFSYSFPYKKIQLIWKMNNSAKKHQFLDAMATPGIYYRLRGPFLSVFSSTGKIVLRFEAMLFYSETSCRMIGLFGVPLYKFVPFFIVSGLLMGDSMIQVLKLICILLPVSFFFNLIASALTEGKAKEQVINWIEKELGGENGKPSNNV